MRPTVLVLFFTVIVSAQELSIVPTVEHQPLAAQVLRLVEALQILGEPLSASETSELKRLSDAGSARGSVVEIQKILDRHCLVGVNINPESRVKVEEGPAKPELVEQGWRNFLVKVQNEAGITPVLLVDSPNAGKLAGMPEGIVGRRFIDIQMYDKQPMRERLSGLELEYRILQIYSKQAGKREAKLSFNVG